MECIVEQQHVHEQIMEAPEVSGAELLVELLDASLAAEDESAAAGLMSSQQPGLFPADDGSLLQEELSCSSIHARLQEEQGCEDCGLDDGILLQPGFELEGCRCSASPAPYANEPVEHWTEEMALGAFDGECVGEWYMDDSMAMDLQWDDGRSYYSFYYPSYGGEACEEQFCSSPLWE